MIKKNIKFLDLSENPLMSKKFYDRLAEILELHDFKIEKLFLEGNKMKDNYCQILCNQLQEKTSLQILNLNDNKLTDKSAEYICPMIRNC